jgi:hypothetical protein
MLLFWRDPRWSVGSHPTARRAPLCCSGSAGRGPGFPQTRPSSESGQFSRLNEIFFSREFVFSFSGVCLVEEIDAILRSFPVDKFSKLS